MSSTELTSEAVESSDGMLGLFGAYGDARRPRRPRPSFEGRSRRSSVSRPPMPTRPRVCVQGDRLDALAPPCIGSVGRRGIVRNEVGVLRVSPDVVGDERADRHDAETAPSDVRQRSSDKA